MTSSLNKIFSQAQLISRKRLALTLLISFFLTYMGQAFALPMACDMANGDNDTGETTSEVSPCHSMQANPKALLEAQASSISIVMDCCDQTDASITHDCACPDSGCGASLTFILNVSSSSLAISEQALYFSSPRFLSQIDSALFRPPIA